MITIAILILIVAKALPGLNTHISSIHVTRITSIVFLFAGALSLNSLNLENIGSGIGIYSGFFQVTTISQLIEIFLFIVGGGILIAWPQRAIQDQHNLSFSPVALAVSIGNLTSSPTFPSEGSASYFNFQKKNENKGSLFLAYQMEGERSIGERDSYSYNKNGAKASGGSIFSFAGGTDYSLVVLFSSLGSSLLISSYDLISVYLSIELQSFGLYILSTLYRDSESSTSAGLKYFLLGGLSSCIILLGTGIIYSYTGTTNLESLYIINSVIDGSRLYIIQGINLGLSLIFIGFLFKIAAAPLHNWSPDVYDGTPTIVTIWLTIIPKIAILFILLELQIKLGSFGPLGGGLKTLIVNNSGYLINFNTKAGDLSWANIDLINLIFTNPFPALDPLDSAPSLYRGGELSQILGVSLARGDNILKTLLLISATLSLIIGSLLGLAQIRVKRLLAYSTISHIGFILLALAVNTEQSIDSFIFYIIQYTITNLNIFLVILGLTYCLSNYTYPRDLDISPSFSPSLNSYNKNGAALQNKKTGGICAGGANKDIIFISEFKGLFFSNPLLSISLAVSLFSMAGIPPLIGFFSKQLVLYSALQNGYYFISVLAIIVSVISCSYYLQIIKILFTTSTNSYNKNGAALQNINGELSCFAGLRKQEINLTNTHSYLISTLTFTILLFFIKPSLILNSTQLLSLSLFYI